MSGSYSYITIYGYMATDHIAQNFGGRKLWRTWQLTTNPPKFHPPTTFILAIMQSKAANPPMFLSTKMFIGSNPLKAFCHQSFVPYGMYVHIASYSYICIYYTDTAIYHYRKPDKI